jgi:hypothetical protein
MIWRRLKPWSRQQQQQQRLGCPLLSLKLKGSNMFFTWWIFNSFSTHENYAHSLFSYFLFPFSILRATNHQHRQLRCSHHLHKLANLLQSAHKLHVSSLLIRVQFLRLHRLINPKFRQHRHLVQQRWQVRGQVRFAASHQARQLQGQLQFRAPGPILEPL